MTNIYVCLLEYPLANSTRIENPHSIARNPVNKHLIVELAAHTEDMLKEGVRLVIKSNYS